MFRLGPEQHLLSGAAALERANSDGEGTNGGYVYRARVPPEDAGATVIAFHVARFRHSDEAAWRELIAPDGCS